MNNHSSEESSIQWFRQPHVTFQRSDAGGVLIDHDTGNVFETNELGALIWDLLAEQLTTTQLSEKLKTCYDEPLNEVTRDLHTYLQSLHENALIVSALEITKPFG